MDLKTIDLHGFCFPAFQRSFPAAIIGKIHR